MFLKEAFYDSKIHKNGIVLYYLTLLKKLKTVKNKCIGEINVEKFM